MQTHANFRFLSIHFRIDATPELLYWFSEQTLQPGPTVSLKCVATGNPPPQFTWTLDGFPVSAHRYCTVKQIYEFNYRCRLIAHCLRESLYIDLMCIEQTIENTK